MTWALASVLLAAGAPFVLWPLATRRERPADAARVPPRTDPPPRP